MCVIFFYANSNPAPGGFKLILASNRDEFYKRETLGAAKWINADHVFGGRDLEPGRVGGTWLAIAGNNDIFKVGALLNLTGEPKPRNAVVSNISSRTKSKTTRNNPNTTTTTSSTKDNNFLLGRGMIVTDFVTSTDESTIDNYNSTLVADCKKYSAFNFISIEIGTRITPASITLCSNVPPCLQLYEEGKCYGFGNSLPAVPFHKVQYGQERFQTIVEDYLKEQQGIELGGIEQGKSIAKLINELKSLLKCGQKFWPDPELARRAPNWGEELSAINVRMLKEGYGSRTHTIILIDANNKMHFLEETMAGDDPDGEWLETNIEKQFFRSN